MILCLNKQIHYSIIFISLIYCACQQSGQKIPSKDYTICYLSSWEADEIQAITLITLSEEFTRQTGIPVEFEFLGRDALIELKGRIIKGDMPDIVDHDITELSAFFIINGLSNIHSLNSFFLTETGPDGQENTIDIFNQEQLDVFKINDDYYFCPYSQIISGFFYNKELYRLQNLNPPKTWREFLFLGEVLRSLNLISKKNDITHSKNNAYYSYEIIKNLYGYSELHKTATDRSGAIWDTQEMKTSIDLIDSFRDSNIFSNQYYYHTSSLCDPLPWIFPNMKEIPSDINLNHNSYIYKNIGFFPFPSLSLSSIGFPSLSKSLDNDRKQEYNAMGWALLNNNQNHEISKLFLKFLLRKEMSQQYSESALTISARIDIPRPINIPELEKWLTSGMEYHQQFGGVMNEYPLWWSTVFVPLNDRLIQGKINTEFFLSEIKKASIDYWEQY